MLDGGERTRRLAGFHEVIALVGKIQRCFHERGQVEQIAIDVGNSPGERAFELIERRARLGRRDGVDQVGDGLGLDEVDAAVQECAQREFTGLRQTRTGDHRVLDDLAEHNRTAVRADLDDVLARIRMRSREVGRHHLIAVHSRERGVSRL